MAVKKLIRCITVAVIFSFACLDVSAQWQKTAGPPGMSVKVFYQRGNVLFAGTSLYGIFRSLDNGVTWNASGRGINGRTVAALIANSSFLFAGTDSGIYRSADNGETWQPAKDGMGNRYILCMKFFNGYLFAGVSYSGLYKSDDDGNTWASASGNALNNLSVRAIAYSASQHLVALADYYLRYSDDNGNSWSEQKDRPFISGVNCSFFTMGDSLLVSDENTVHRSFDGGITWSTPIKVSPAAPLTGFAQEGKFILAGTKDGLYFTSNFGKIWKIISTNSIRNGYFQFADAFYKSGNYYLFGYNEIGVGYSSDTGKSWAYSLQGFAPAATPAEILATAGNTLLSGTQGDGLYRSTGAGSAWIKTGNTNNNRDTFSNTTITALFKNKNLVLAGAIDGLYRSQDNGTTWQHNTNGLPKGTYPGSFAVRSVVKTNAALLAGTSLGIFYSVDDGVSWLPTNITSNVADLAANDSVACAALDDDPYHANLYRSVKSPAVWNFVYEQYGVKWSTIACNGKSYFYASTVDHYNYVSPDNGTTWNLVGSGIPLLSGGNAIAARDNYVFIGNADGIYFSGNYGASFIKENKGFNKLHTIESLTLSSDYIYAGIGQNSIWKRPLSDFGIQPLQQQRETNNIPLAFAPNPLRNTGILTYTLETSSRVSINLYNANGNFIKNIKETNEEKGTHTIAVTKERLQNGNYFITINTAGGQGLVNIIVSGN